MSLIVTIDGVDRTNQIALGSLMINNVVNQRTDTCDFEIFYKSFKPEINKEIIITDGGTRIFAGVIIRVDEVSESLGLRYAVECKDYSHFLDRKLVLERFRDETVEDIIEFIRAKYAPDFTLSGVSVATVVKSITFNRVTVSECFQTLAERLNYSWYVDYNKAIHFFATNDELAPFGITDTTNAIRDSLEITSDISQLRNRILVEGGEEEGNQVTEQFIAPSDVEERKVYRLAYKYAEKPTVEVNNVEVDVGIEYLDDETAFDAYWSYAEKYIRFRDTQEPAASDTVEVIGIPLFPIFVSRSDNDSIDTYGVYEFAKTDRTIRSRDEALQYALSELNAYKDGVREGGFETYEAGLKAGQVINIDSTQRNIDEDFLIQSVQTEYTGDKARYKVALATLRTVGIIEFLQGLVKSKKIDEADVELILGLIELSDSFTMTDTTPTVTTETTEDYVWEANSGDAQPNPIIWNEFTWSA